GQLNPFLRVKGIDRLNQADGPDGDEILNPNPGILKFPGDINHQPKVAFDQQPPDRPVTGLELFQKVIFLLERQRGWQGFAPADIKDDLWIESGFLQEFNQPELAE